MRHSQIPILGLLSIHLWLVGSLHPCAAEDWPTWQHDNRRSGSTPEQLDTDKLELDWTWKSPSPPQTAWAGPAKYDAYAFHRNLPSMRNYDSVFHLIAVDDRIWFGSSVDDSLYCLGASNGRQQWVVTGDGPVRLAPTWHGGRVYFGSDDGFVRCVDAQSGHSIWKFSPTTTGRRVLNNGRFISLQPCRTGVVVEDNTAWFACAMLPWEDSYLCALDATSGTKTSNNHFVKTLPGRTMEGAPALSSGALILPQGRVSPRVFDRHTGDDLGEMAKSGGGSVVVVSLDENVLHGPGSDPRKGSFRQSSGKSREMVAAMGRGNALVVDGDRSWMLTDDSIVASDLTTQNVLWKASCDCPFAMIKAGDTLFVGGDQTVAAYSAIDGKPLWRRAAEGRVFGLVAARGRLFASSDTGVIHCYSRKGTSSPEASPEDSSPSSNEDQVSDRNQHVAVVNPIDDERLLGHWAFQPSLTTGNDLKALRGSDLVLSSEARFSRLGDYHAMELDGVKETVMVSPEFRQVAYPRSAFSADAWVRLDQFLDWGGIIGIIQDNGSDEKGWMLGYRKDRFCIAVKSTEGPGKLTYLSADQPFELSRWNHVAGTYDGDTMRLYVNGRLCAQNDQQSGEIDYPQRAWFEIGAYHDKDEYFRMAGGLHEVRLYSQALSAEEINQHYQTTQPRFPEPVKETRLASGPWLTFSDPTTATVRWSTKEPQPTRLDYGIADFSAKVMDPAPRREHRAVLTNLDRNRVYQYRIGEVHGDETRFTVAYECDNFFNYSPRPAQRIPGESDPSARQLAQQLLAQTTARRGMCLILGEIDAKVLIELCRMSELRFVAALENKDDVETSRSLLRDHGVYGNQVAVHHANDLGELPFPGNWANLVVANKTSVTPDVIREAQRQTRPEGGVTLVIQDAAVELPSEFERMDGESTLTFHRYMKPALPGSGDWSHLYGAPNNSAFGGEQLAGAKSADDLAVQWVGRPGPRYQADRSGRKPSPLAIGGRLFLQGLHRIIAVDAFNGTIVWSLEIPGLERFNMPRDCSNWCASRDYLFAAVKGECWKIDAATGDVLQRTAAASDSVVPMDWGYIATDSTRLYGSTVRAGTSWTSFWGGGDAGWYDARSGAVTFPICSDTLFCRDVRSMDRIWEYRRGVILNPTITVSGDTMYFVESRGKSILASNERRIGSDDLWKNMYLVAVDSYTGSPKWEKKLPPMQPQVVFYLAHAANQLTLVSSSDKSYRITSLDDRDGAERWTQSTAWAGGKGDHGKAMMRPAIVGDRVFVRPNVLSLQNGSVLPQTMPDGHGCGTYACTADAIFYRAGTVTMWNPEDNVKSVWPRLRPDCWLSTIPAGGMLLSPEGGGGCSCGSWMETSIGFIPRKFQVAD